jgi:peptidyl-tRNA hydrolase, PTH1 family
MPRSKRLIVGLGNPGAEYEKTRHNIGFEVAKALADRADVALQGGKHDALLGWGRWRSFPLGVLLPLAYVNRSGGPVRAVANQHDIAADELIVIVDDLHLDVGTLRLRPGGGSGGHNGLKDIAARLGTTHFPRLRIGIGNDYARGRQADYVLARFTEAQRATIDAALPTIVDAALTFVTDGIETAMNRFN